MLRRMVEERILILIEQEVLPIIPLFKIRGVSGVKMPFLLR